MRRRGERESGVWVEKEPGGGEGGERRVKVGRGGLDFWSLFGRPGMTDRIGFGNRISSFDAYRVWSGRYLFFPKSEPDLTVDLNNCVIDASSRCGLSLAARVTVEPAGHSGACH